MFITTIKSSRNLYTTHRDLGDFDIVIENKTHDTIEDAYQYLADNIEYYSDFFHTTHDDYDVYNTFYIYKVDDNQFNQALQFVDLSCINMDGYKGERFEFLCMSETELSEVIYRTQNGEDLIETFKEFFDLNKESSVFLLTVLKRLYVIANNEHNEQANNILWDDFILKNKNLSQEDVINLVT